MTDKRYTSKRVEPGPGGLGAARRAAGSSYFEAGAFHSGTGHSGTGQSGTGHSGTGHSGTGHSGTGRHAGTDDPDEPRASRAQGHAPHGTAHQDFAGDDLAGYATMGHNDAGMAGEGDADFGATIHASASAPNGETSGPEGSKGAIVRNFLVAVATVPFVFLLVLIASMFVLGPNAAEQGPSVSAERVRLSIDADAVTAASRAGALATRTDPSGTPADKPATASSLVVATPDQLDAVIALPVRGPVRSVGIDGDRLALLVGSPEGDVIVVYDVLQSRPLARFRIDQTGDALATSQARVIAPVGTFAPVVANAGTGNEGIASERVPSADMINEDMGLADVVRAPRRKSVVLPNSRPEPQGIGTAAELDNL